MIAVAFFFYEFSLRTIIGSLSSQLIPQLHLTSEQFALLETGYGIAYGSMQIPVGFITDTFGLRKTMTFAILGCALSLEILAHAQGFGSAFLSRTFMGLTSSFSFICLLMVIISWLPQRLFAFFTGLSQFLGTMGPILAAGPLVLLIQRFGGHWRFFFGMIALLGFGLAIITALVVRQRQLTSRERLLIQSKPPLFTRLIALLKNKNVWVIAVFSGAGYAPIALLGITWGTAYLQANNVSQDQAAGIISVMWLSYAIACPAFGLLSDFFRSRLFFMFFSSLTGLIATLYLTLISNQNYSDYLVIYTGIGVAAAGQTLGFVMMAEQVHSFIRASALGFNNAMLSVFIAVSPLVVGIFMPKQMQYRLDHFVAGDFRIGFLILPILYLISLTALAMLLFRKQNTPARILPKAA